MCLELSPLGLSPFPITSMCYLLVFFCLSISFLTSESSGLYHNVPYWVLNILVSWIVSIAHHHQAIKEKITVKAVQAAIFTIASVPIKYEWEPTKYTIGYNSNTPLPKVMG